MRCSIQDGLKFEKNGKVVVFNHHSFCELVKHIMVRYGNVTYQHASELLNASDLINEPKNFDQALRLTHELEYHWAMLVLHGHMYWTKGIANHYNDFRDEYCKWEEETILKYGLKTSYEFY